MTKTSSIICNLCMMSKLKLEWAIYLILIVHKEETEFRCTRHLLESRFFKNRELYWTNLPQNSNFGAGTCSKIQGSNLRREGQIILSRFLFIFIFSIKNWILTHKILVFILFCQLNINKNRFIEIFLFYFYVTC